MNFRELKFCKLNFENWNFKKGFEIWNIWIESEFWKVIWGWNFYKKLHLYHKKKKWRLERAKCLAHWGLHQTDKGLEQFNKRKTTCQVACSEAQSYIVCLFLFSISLPQLNEYPYQISPSCFCLPPQATIRSPVHHSGKMSSSTTAMASYALCHTSMQLVFLRKRSPPLQENGKNLTLPSGPKTKEKNYWFLNGLQLC